MAFLVSINEIDKTAVDHTPYPMHSGSLATYFTDPIYIQNLGTGSYRIFTPFNTLLADMTGQFCDLSEQGLSGITSNMFGGTLYSIYDYVSTNNLRVIYMGSFSPDNKLFVESATIPAGSIVTFECIVSPQPA